MVARSAIAAWRDHHVSIGGGCHAQEQRWNGQIGGPRPLRKPPWAAVGGQRAWRSGAAPRFAAAPLVRADAMLSNLVKESKARRAEIAADNGEAPQHDAHAPCCA